MGIFQYILPFVIALGTLVFFHELGHYLVARCCGVKILRFSIGFGYPLLKWTVGKDRTEWVLALLPLGGYVKMLDETEAPVSSDEKHRAFNQQKVWKRILIVLAGPVANLFLAVLFYWIIFSSGIQDMTARIQVNQHAPFASIVEQSGLQSGDLVLQANQKTIRSWTELQWELITAMLESKKLDLQVKSPSGQSSQKTLNFSHLAFSQTDNPIANLGLSPSLPKIPAIIGRIMPNSAAEQAGLQSYDRILAVNHHKVSDWASLIKTLDKLSSPDLELTIERSGDILELPVSGHFEEKDGRQIIRLGIMVDEQQINWSDYATSVKYGPIESLDKAFDKTLSLSVLTFKSIGMMFMGNISWRNISGPVTIATYAQKSAHSGWSAFLSFMALISVSLGVLNLLPIPVLDGGHLLYYIAELVRGKPLPLQVIEFGFKCGFFLIILMMGLAFYNDINRLILS